MLHKIAVIGDTAIWLQLFEIRFCLFFVFSNFFISRIILALSPSWDFLSRLEMIKILFYTLLYSESTVATWQVFGRFGLGN